MEKDGCHYYRFRNIADMKITVIKPVKVSIFSDPWKIDKVFVICLAILSILSLTVFYYISFINVLQFVPAKLNYHKNVLEKYISDEKKLYLTDEAWE